MATIVFGELSRGFWLRQFFGVLIIWSAFTAPFLCVDRRPVDLARALYAREDLTFDERPEVRQVYDDLTALRRKEKGTWFLIAGQESYVLPFLQLQAESWILTSQWEQIFKFPDSGKGLPRFVLALNRPIPAGLPLVVEKRYADDTYILRSDN